MSQIPRRACVCASLAVLLLPRIAWSQRHRVPRVGLVSPAGRGARDEAFLHGLRDLGYVDGRNVVLEVRFADGQPERLPGLVQELMELRVDVLVVGATIGARAAKQASTTILNRPGFSGELRV